MVEERDYGEQAHKQLKMQNVSNKAFQHWTQLPQKKKDFYKLVADIEFLKEDYEKTQGFYNDRVQKIKNDSSFYFNGFSIR